jgi:hypothetical protein
MRRIFIPAISLYVCLSIYLLLKTIPVWIDANNCCKSIVKNYESFTKFNRVYILGVPSYYHGLAAFRSAFNENIFYAFGKKPENIEVVAGYYCESDADTIRSVLHEKNIFCLQARKKQTPFFTTGAGWPKSFKTQEYEVKFDSSGCAYKLIFEKDIPSGTAFIYTSGNEWRRIN